MANTPPKLTGLGPSVTFLENTVNAGPQLLDSNVTFTDPNSNFSGGTLTVTGLLAEDSVGIRDVGFGAGQIGFSGGTVSFGGIAIGTVTGGNAGTSLTVTFNASATSTAIDALIQNLTYANSSDTPTATRMLSVTVTDAAGAATLDLAHPSFTELTGAANPFDGINLANYSAPTFADLDSDGDLDLIAGSYDGSLFYFKNTGTASVPVFVLQTGAADPFSTIPIYSTALHPAFADLDGDGDLDFTFGSANGRLVYSTNIGSPSAPVFASLDNPFNPSGVFGYNAAPSFGDLDGDGDIDAVVGDSDGMLHYFKNSGTSSAPALAEVIGAANPFDTFDVGRNATPTLTDLDGDGDLDLVVGELNGVDLTFFLNTGTASAPVFVEQTGAANPFARGFVREIHPAPVFADLDHDGDLDLVLGQAYGDLLFFRNDAPGALIVVNVNAEADNAAPSLTGLGPSATFLENTVNAAPQVLDGAVVFTDPDNNFDGGTLTVTGLLAEDSVGIRNIGSAAGQIGFSGGTVSFGGIAIGTATGGNAGTSLTVTFNLSATATAIDALIQNLTYADSSDTPTASRTLTVKVLDAAGASTGNVQITVNVTPESDNSPPVAAATAGSGAEDGGRIAITLTGSDADIADVVARFNLASLPGHGQVFAAAAGGAALISGDSIAATGNGAGGYTATVYYQPNAQYSGGDSFTYTAFDGHVSGAPATASITLNGVQNAFDDALTTSEDTAGTLDVLANDTFGAGATVTGVTNGAHGTVVNNNDGTVTYTPVANYSGTDTFTYTANITGGSAETATITVTVNVLPDAVDDTLAINEDMAGTVNVLTNDTFGAGATVIGTTNGAHGTVVINNDGTLTYTPSANYHGADSFTYTTNTPGGTAETATVTVTVAAIQDAFDDTLTSNEDTAGTLNVLANDTLGAGATITGVTNGAHGSVVNNNDGTVTYTPAADYNGTDSFTYTAHTTGGVAETVTVTVTVTAVQDAVNDTLTINEDTAGTVNVLANDSFTGTGRTVTAVTNGAHGTVTINNNGTLTFRPVADYFGVDTFSYTAISATGTAETATVNVTVTAINDAPVLDGLPAAAGYASGPAVILAPGLTISDVDSSTLNSATVQVSAGAFAAHGDVLAVSVADLAGTNIVTSYNAATETLTLSGTDTLAHYTQVLANVTFQTTNFGLDRAQTIAWQVNDGAAANNLSELVTTAISMPRSQTNDFSGTGHGGILWQNTDGTPAIWSVDGTSLLSGANVGFNPGTSWHEIGTGDFNGDGKSDILWQHTDGTIAEWFMDGTTLVSGGSVAFNPGAAWHAIGSGDFNGDGKADILWQNADGTPAVWLMDGLNILAGANVGSNPGAAWHVIDSGDFNGDGKADILWQNNNGQAAVWLMDGTSLISGSNIGANPGPSWNVQAAGDFNGDGKADILWQNDSGQAAVWLMDGTSLISGANVGFNPGAAWQAHDAVDFNADGKADILWQNTDGTPAVWLMDGLDLVAGANVGFNPGANWHVVPQHHDLLV